MRYLFIGVLAIAGGFGCKVQDLPPREVFILGQQATADVLAGDVPVDAGTADAAAEVVDDGDVTTDSPDVPAPECIAASECSDGKPCTVDTCDPTLGCVHNELDDVCDDGDACTANDKCAAGACAPGAAVGCDDGEPCTDDGCDKLKGCASVANSAPCNDANACTSDDTCTGSICSGQALNCDDKNPCTGDSCDSTGGCQHADNSVLCDDGNPCTTGDLCTGGACAGGKDVCKCASDSDCMGLDNGNLCDGVPLCKNLTCILDSTIAVQCDGSKDTACVKAQCQPTTGQCANTQVPNGTVCDDGKLCTKADQCQQGACAGAPLSCNDGNPCTADTCEPMTGCTYVDDPIACCKATVCGNACVDTKTNGSHCGTCGHDCLGGGCAAGACQPKVIASGLYFPDKVAVADKFVFFTDKGNKTIYKVAKDGSGGVSDFVAASYVQKMLTSGGKFFWQPGTESVHILDETSAGTVPAPIIPKAVAWTLSGSTIYWLQPASKECECLGKEVGKVSCNPIGTNDMNVCASLNCTCPSDGKLLSAGFDGKLPSTLKTLGVQYGLASVGISTGATPVVLLSEKVKGAVNCPNWSLSRVKDGVLQYLASGIFADLSTEGDDTYAYFFYSKTCYGWGALSRTLSTGGAIVTLKENVYGPLVRSGPDFFVVSGNDLYRFPANAANPTFTLVKSKIGQFAIDDKAIYMSDPANGTILRLAK